MAQAGSFTVTAAVAYNLHVVPKYCYRRHKTDQKKQGKKEKFPLKIDRQLADIAYLWPWLVWHRGVRRRLPILQISLEEARLLLRKPVRRRIMRIARHNQQVKVPVRLDQRVGELHRAGRVDHVVHLVRAQHQRPRQLPGVRAVGNLPVARVDRPAHVHFIPSRRPQPGVVARRMRDGGLVEIAVVQDRRRRAVAARRAALYADALEVHLRMRLGCRLYPCNVVGNTRIHVLVSDVVESFGAPICAHAINHDNDVACLWHCTERSKVLEVLGHNELGWVGVNDIDDRIRHVFVEIWRLDDDAVDIRLVIAALGNKPLRENIRALQRAKLCFMKKHDLLPRSGVNHAGTGQQVDARP